MTEHEINGDTRLSPMDRLRYLFRNLGRNLAVSAGALPTRAYCRGRATKADGTPSPGRLIGHAFLLEELPKILPRSEIAVLDIGCGSGSSSVLLAQAGFRGTYVGVDVDDRFDRDMPAADRFERRFVHGNAHDLPETAAYDLVFSNSALEHIPNDRLLLDKLDRLVAPGGLQVHVVPSGWGLLLYLWHGYRQYPLCRLKAVLPEGPMRVYRLGGLCCFLIHFAFITAGEMLLRLKLRARLPGVYRALLNGALSVDRVLAVCPSMYIVCRSKGQGDGGSPDAKTKAGD